MDRDQTATNAVSVSVTYETESNFAVQVEGPNGGKSWIPKSLISNKPAGRYSAAGSRRGDELVLVLPKWKARSEGWGE